MGSKCPDQVRFAIVIFKLRLGALIPRSVGLSVGLSVLQKLQKNYKTLQNITKRYKMLQNIEIMIFTYKDCSRKLWQNAGASLMESSFFGKGYLPI